MEPTQIKFEKPQIVDHGDLSELTAGAEAGACLDADFPDGTPFDDLTFSAC